MTPPGLSTGTIVSVGALGGLALIVFYLVGRRATRIVVPFVGPWLRAPSERHAGRWAHRLRRMGSLLLQLAILASILAGATTWFGDGGQGSGNAATDPNGSTPHGRTIALLLDRSASMQGRDEPGSRMGRARAAAADVVAGLNADDRAVVVAFAADAVARTGLERDRARLTAAVSAIEAGDEPGNLPGALDFAAALLRGQPRPTLILIGDGGGGDVRDPAAVAAVRDVDVRFVPVGQRARNLAIVAFSARRQPADPSSADLSLVISSFQDDVAELELAVTAGPKRIPIARQHLRIEPHTRVARTLIGVPVPDARIEARLEDTGDDLPLDDRAFAVVPQPARLSVMAVGTSDLYLDGALLSLGPSVAVEHVPPESMEASRRRWAAADVVIFHGVTPHPAPSDGGRFLYLGPTGPDSPWRGTATGPSSEVRDPVVSDVARDHPLVRGLSLADLNVLDARRLTPGPGDTVVVAAARLPLLIARDRPHARVVALAFDPRRSDLPMRSAFPLWLANALTWLAQRSEPEALSWPTGRTVQVGTPSTALTLDHVGFFTAGDPRADGVVHVAANLASAEESDLTPRARLRIGELVPPRPDPPAPVPRRRPRPAALALLLALGLCTAEWLTFHRRLTV